MGQTLEFSLPPLRALCFIPFIYLQAVLLHPAIPSRTSRVLRFLLMFPAAYLAAGAPFWWRVEPVEHAVGANFRWGIWGPAFLMKAVEWGLCQDRKAYTWIGFDDATVVPTLASDYKGTSTINKGVNGGLSSDSSANISATSSAISNKLTSSTARNGHNSHLPTPPDSPRPSIAPADIGTSGAALTSKRRRARSAAHTDSALTVALDALHLLTAMRGIGYAFGPPLKSLAAGASKNTGRTEFALRATKRFIRSHIISTVCLLVMIHRYTYVPLYLGQLLKPLGLSQKWANELSLLLAYFCVGVSLHAQMLVGFEGTSLVFLAISFLPLPQRIRPTWDAREWPPLFKLPHKPENITVFWSQQWHALFRKPFTTIGYEPVAKYLTPVVGKQLARSAGAMAVFGLSAWMHAQGFWSARYQLPPPRFEGGRPMTPVEWCGAWIFFLSQGGAVIAEGIFTSVTGRKVKGRWGRVWSLLVIVCIGCLAGKNWIALGLVDGLPTIEQWGWQRFVLPTVALAPMPLYCR